MKGDTPAEAKVILPRQECPQLMKGDTSAEVRKESGHTFKECLQ